MTISSPPDRSINRFVPRAAAQIAGETGPDAVEGRPASERDRRHDHPGGADAALCTAVLHERALQRMTAAKPLDGHDPRTGGVRCRHETRIHRRPVDEHGARTALAFAAALLRTGETALLPQHIEQTLHRMDVEARALAVDGGLEFHVSTLATCMSFSGVAGISRISNPACRSALMTAGAGPSIGSSPVPFAPKGPCGYGFSSTVTSIGGVSSVVGMM